jgi:hypothetical protein
MDRNGMKTKLGCGAGMQEFSFGESVFCDLEV